MTDFSEFVVTRTQLEALANEWAPPKKAASISQQHQGFDERQGAAHP
jgi:hypothetical protein